MADTLQVISGMSSLHRFSLERRAGAIQLVLPEMLGGAVVPTRGYDVSYDVGAALSCLLGAAGRRKGCMAFQLAGGLDIDVALETHGCRFIFAQAGAAAGKRRSSLVHCDLATARAIADFLARSGPASRCGLRPVFGL